MTVWTTDFDTLVQTLGLDGASEPWREGWPESQTVFAGEAEKAFHPLRLREACQFLDIEEAGQNALQDNLDEIRANEPLFRLAWHCYRRFNERPRFCETQPPHWPTLPESMGSVVRLFYGIVLLAGLPQILELHRRRGVDASVTRDTLDDFGLWLRHYHALHGVWGLAECDWLANHFSGRIYQLGRLQFMLDRYAGEFTVYRRVRDGEVVALAGNGCRFRADGQYDGANGIFDTAGAWTSTFAEDAEKAEGNPVSPDGEARPDRVVLPKPEWRRILAPGDCALSVHIPATGPMDPESCSAAFERAGRFFPAVFPEFQFKAFTCHSWLLDHQLTQYLSAASNIVQFLGRFLLLPVPEANDRQTLERVFGSPAAEPVAGPGATSLQRHVAAHVQSGGRWRGALGVIPAN